MRWGSRPASGGLLPRHFTLTGTEVPAVSFCCAILAAAYRPRHPSFQKDSLPCAVRTFLPGFPKRLPEPLHRLLNIQGILEYTRDFPFFSGIFRRGNAGVLPE